MHTHNICIYTVPTMQKFQKIHDTGVANKMVHGKKFNEKLLINSAKDEQTDEHHNNYSFILKYYYTFNNAI